MQRPRYYLPVAVLLIVFAAPAAAQSSSQPSIPRKPDVPACQALIAPAGESSARPDAPETVVRLMRCGDVFESHAEYRRALGAFQMAVSVAERIGDDAHAGEALQGVGDELLKLGNGVQAEAFYQRSLDVRRQAHDRDHEADVLGALGRARWMQGRYDEARTLHRQALAIYQEVHDQLGIAVADNNLATTYMRFGDYPGALGYMRQSLEALTGLGDRRRSATVLDNMGDAYRRLGDYERALELAERAMSIRSELGLRDGIAKSLDSLAAIYQDQGNYTAALARLEKSLATRTELGLAHDVAEALLNIGNVYAAEGAFAQAERYFRRALAAASRLGNEALETDVRTQLGTVQHLEGRSTLALATLRRALAGPRRAEYPQQLDAARFALARVMAATGRLTTALVRLRQCLSYRDRIGHRPDKVDVLIEMALVERRRGRGRRALQLATEARGLAGAMRLADAEWRALTEMGRAQEVLGRPAAAARAFEDAIAIVEDLRARLAGTGNAVALFFADRQAPYRARIALALAAGRAEEAFAFAERAKARTLLDAIGADRFPASTPLTPDERRRERQLETALRSANAQLMAAAASAGQDVGRFAALERSQDAARLAYEDFQAAAHAAHADPSGESTEAVGVGVADAVKMLDGRPVGILEFVVGSAHVWAFVLDGSGLRVVQLPATSAALARDVGRFRTQLASRDLRIGATARRVYDEIIRPVRPAIAGKTELVIVPDGPLWDLPFQALQSAPTHYFIEDVALSYAPSVAVLREVMRHGRTGPGPATLLAFGDPSTNGPPAANVGSPGSLPDAATQVAELAALYGPTSRVYVGPRRRKRAGRPRLRTIASWRSRLTAYSTIAARCTPTSRSPEARARTRTAFSRPGRSCACDSTPISSSCRRARPRAGACRLVKA
jgi:tetratricopeptide (TPR) repeat protein